MKHIVLLSAALWLVPWCGFAAEETVARSPFTALLKKGQTYAAVSARGARGEDFVDTDVVFTATRVEDFEVDGDLGKEIWRKGVPVPAIGNRQGTWPKELSGDIRILYSTKALYVGATLWQDMSKMYAKWDQRDLAIWNDDNLEMFLHLANERGQDLYQYSINPIGSLADLRSGDLAYWTKGMKLKVRRFDDRWTIEWRIPFAWIPMDRPLPGDFIAVRFCRAVHNPNAVGQVPVLLTNGNQQLSRFAKLVFAPPEGELAAKASAEDRAYREKELSERFHRRFEAVERRVAEVRGAAARFAKSAHPLHRRALAGVAQMKKALDGFRARNADALASRRLVPEKESRAILDEAEGFARFASDNAYVVWTGDPWARGAPDDLPPEDAPLMRREIVFEQAGNEREAVCLNLSGLLCGSRLDLRVVPQSVDAKDGPFVSCDAFEVYTEPFVDIDNETWTAPLVRAPGNVVTVTPGETVRVWIMFNSRGVAPGTYRTRVSFKRAYSTHVADRQVPVVATVWNFALPETHDWPVQSFFWGPYQYHEDEVALLELMHDYHVTHAWTQHHRYQYGLYGDNRYYTGPRQGKGGIVDGRDFDDDLAQTGNEDFLRRAKELGMRFMLGWGTPKSVEWFKLMKKRLDDLGFGYDDYAFQGLLLDEFTKKDIPALAKYRDAVTAWGGKMQFMATYISSPPPTGATLDDLEESGLLDFFKVWMVINGGLVNPPKGPETISRMRAKGCKVWTYRCNVYMHRQGILSYYRFHPWTSRLYGLDGCALWTIQSPKGDDGWDWRDGFDDGIAWRGLDKKPVPTKRLQAFREGLEDVSYMDRLEKELKRVGADRFPSYVRLLDDRRGIVKRADQKEVDDWRLAVGRAIDSLCRMK